MRMVSRLSILIVTFLAISSCAPKEESQLELTLYNTELSLLPTKAFSCTDVQSGSTTPSIAELLFHLGKIKIKWKDKKAKFNVTYLRISTDDPAMSGLNCVYEGTDLVYLATGATPTTSTLLIDQNTEITLPNDNALCKISCGSLAYSDPKNSNKTVAITIDIVGVDETDKPKGYRAVAEAVLLPPPQ